jgi:hypothetical protein
MTQFDPANVDSVPPEPNAEPAKALVRIDAFRDLVRDRAHALLDLATYLVAMRPSEALFARTLLGNLMFQSAQLVELLDEYGARRNAAWSGFRVLTSTIKLFARISYGLAHLSYVLPGYRLLPVQGDFFAATLGQLRFVNHIIETAAERLLGEAKLLEVLVDATQAAPLDFHEVLLPRS